MDRCRGTSVRFKLTLSYAGFLMVAGALLLTIVYLFLLRYVPDGNIIGSGRFVPNRSDLLRAFAPPATIALFFLLVFGLVGGWFLAGRMLAPLTHINNAASRASEGVLSHRIRLEGRRDEFRDLADAFDTMLGRLEEHVAEQQRFAANASHELRTPLAASQAMLDVAARDPARDVDALIDRLQTVNTRAIALTEALLVLAQADGRAFERVPVDLSLFSEEAVETLHPLAERHGVSITIGGSVAAASGSPALLQQLVINLVHNAIVHNLPLGGMVIVRTEATPGTATLTVENTGELLAPALVATLAEPFQRGAGRARGSDHVGAGLGLAIAAGIARAHGGVLELTPRSGGGLVATVKLPGV